MRTNTLHGAMLAGLIVLFAGNSHAAQPPEMKMTTPIPEPITAPDNVKTSIGTLEFDDGVPTEATRDSVYDYLDTSRAVNVYLNSTPTLSINALREGQVAAGCADSHQVCIFDDLMDSTALFLTGNTSTMYAVGFLDLNKDGPTVHMISTLDHKRRQVRKATGCKPYRVRTGGWPCASMDHWRPG